MLSTFLYYADNAILILVAFSVAVYAWILSTSRGRLLQLRTAYLGYAVCALAIAWFQLQLYASGAIATMLIGLVLIPIAVAGTLAVGNTVSARSATLRLLGVSTIVVVLLLVLAGFWNVAGPLAMVIAHAYELLVVVACACGWREWQGGARTGPLV